MEAVYKKYSGLKTMPGKKAFMCTEEFRRIVFESRVDKDIAERDLGLTFNLSMMSQVDELRNNKIFEMNFVEFIELMCRLAEKISLPSMYYSEEEIKDLTREERDLQPLCLKIEAMLIRFMNTIVPHDTIMKRYTIPTKSVFTKQGQILEYVGLD